MAAEMCVALGSSVSVGMGKWNRVQMPPTPPPPPPPPLVRCSVCLWVRLGRMGGDACPAATPVLCELFTSHRCRAFPLLPPPTHRRHLAVDSLLWRAEQLLETRLGQTHRMWKSSKSVSSVQSNTILSAMFMCTSGTLSVPRAQARRPWRTFLRILRQNSSSEWRWRQLFPRVTFRHQRLVDEWTVTHAEPLPWQVKSGLGLLWVLQAAAVRKVHQMRWVRTRGSAEQC